MKYQPEPTHNLIRLSESSLHAQPLGCGKKQIPQFWTNSEKGGLSSLFKISGKGPGQFYNKTQLLNPFAKIAISP